MTLFHPLGFLALLFLFCFVLLLFGRALLLHNVFIAQYIYDVFILTFNLQC